MKISRFLVRRILGTLITVPAALFIVFTLLRVTGNPVAAALGDRLSAAELERRISLAGLNRPLGEQYLSYLAGLFQGDLGSTFKGEKVSEKIWFHLAASMELAFFGLIVLFLSILVFGLLAAWYRNGPVDKFVSVASIVTFALPGFLGAVLVREASRLVFPDFDVIGRLSLTGQITWNSVSKTGFITVDSILQGDLDLLIDGLLHLVLPAFSIAFISGTLIRVFRDAINLEIESTYSQSALNRGITKGRVFLKHALRPALSPLLAAFGVTAGGLITGIVFIERVFEIQGLGYLLVKAVLERDFMLVQGIFLVTLLIVSIVNLLVDVLQVKIDRRKGQLLL